MPSELKMTSIPAISAIYYALLNCGYEYACIGRDSKHCAALLKHKAEDAGLPFYESVRQNTCEVYPYWPRASMLEIAALHVDVEHRCFSDTEGLRLQIMSSENIADAERDDRFWSWMAGFPSALRDVLLSEGFARYQVWEKQWLDDQKRLHQAALERIAHCVAECGEKYDSPVRNIQVVINPIKCIYSADYHLLGEQFIFCSGRFQGESVIHEYLHHVVHPVVKQYQEQIIQDERSYPNIDASYYTAGRLNAFEEYIVRRLTDEAMKRRLPDDLGEYVREHLM